MNSFIHAIINYRRTTPPCDQSDSLLAAIHVLATAMATEALSQSQGDSPQFKQIKTESALRGLAEAVVTVSYRFVLLDYEQYLNISLELGRLLFPVHKKLFA